MLARGRGVGALGFKAGRHAGQYTTKWAAFLAVLRLGRPTQKAKDVR